MNIETHLLKMESRFADSIEQPKLDPDSSNVESVDYLQNTKDIKWLANEVGEFSDETIPEFFARSDYAKRTRWDLWNKIVAVLQKQKVESLIDIGAANNNLAFLAKKAGIDAYGVEPRKTVVHSSDEVFRTHFGDKSRFGFVGSVKTFGDYVLDFETSLTVDCVSVVNFLHGHGHDPEEVKRLFQAFDKCAKFVVLTEPLWSDLQIARCLNKYLLVCEIEVEGLSPHFLFEVIR